MMALTMFSSAVLAGVLLLGPPQEQAPRTVATAGSIRVSAAELTDVLAEARQGEDLQRLADSLSVEGLEGFAREVLERKVLAAEARTLGLEREPRTARAIDRAVDGILAEALLDRTRASVETSEPALRRFFAAHHDRFRSSPRRKTRHIVVASRAEAERALERVRAGEDFAAIAASLNTDSTKATGGDLGWVARGVMVRDFEAAVFALEAGRVSEPVRTSFGWHLVKVEEIDPGTLPPYELVRDRVLEAARADAVERLKARLWQQFPAVIDRAALATLLK